MENILDFYARTHTPYIHANGPQGTAFLINKMRPKAGQRLLEIGFGTGQTMVELACRFPGLDICGLEKSPEMVTIAQKRLRFAGIRGVTAAQMPDSLDFPFPDESFDAVYCESVLAILSDKDLTKIFREIRRVLRRGGHLFFNESLWRPGTSSDKIAAINRQCIEWFGIPQATETWPYPDDWCRLAEQSGFAVLEQVRLHGVRPALPRIFDNRLFRARLFSMFGKLKSRFSPALARDKKRIGQQEKLLADATPYLEGVFFKLRLK